MNPSQNKHPTDQGFLLTRWLRGLYEWTIQWADKPHGTWALFLIAFAESSFFPIPPDVLLIALCVGSRKRSFRFAAICTLGSLMGGMVGYGVGAYAYEWIGAPIVQAYHGEAAMAKIKAWYDTYGFWGNLLAAVTPVPYKVFTIASGAFDFSFADFMLASVVGRTLRFFVVAGLLYAFGAPIKAFIEKYFNWCAWVFMILLIGGFILLKYL